MIKVKPVNDKVVSDEHISTLIPKPPKIRYRQIIEAYYRRINHEKKRF